MKAFRPVPLDIKTREGLLQQVRIAERFGKVWRQTITAFAVLALLIGGRLFFPAGLGEPADSWFAIVVLAVGAMLTICAIRYNCPNCKVPASGTEWRLFSGKAVNKGLHPFPRRCKACGAYLSVRALRRDAGTLWDDVA
ncbi:hypothetical protein [Roseateles asaccharophilus]|uniref:Uncharacterized protein n=1 Tax=Roseateles asaccharophilus TaxID=582607 RepID=A0ABU2A1A0_9BURK|nr:hypothetical protein [Roseateles asaccharophilus]MDR7330964.1 hypothetical protein [Roseateles asaccharophilus]